MATKANLRQVIFHIRSLGCLTAVVELEDLLRNTVGVSRVNISYLTGLATIDFDGSVTSAAALQEALANSVYPNEIAAIGDLFSNEYID